MSKFNPPVWADWLVSRFCRTDRLEEVQGDLHEAFYWRLEEKGLHRARFFFIWEVVRSLGFSNLRLTQFINQFFMMYNNYVKTGWRFIKKNKLYSSLNILGLAIGLGVCWLAYLFANDELSYDKHLPDSDNLYRIGINFKRGDDTHYIGGSSNAMSIKFRDIPEIEGIARIDYDYSMIDQGEEKLLQGLLKVDRELLNYLDLHFLEGAASTFDKPNDVIISESLASKLNLRGKAVGHVLSMMIGESFENFIIRGVYEDIPANTSVQSDMFVSYAHYLANAPERRLTEWFDINMNSIVKLNKSASTQFVEQKMQELHQKNDPDNEGEVTYYLQPISEIHLDDRYGHYNGIARGGEMEMISLFVIIGLFCLIISMINYSNFSISLYINRAREVALRKVIGSGRKGVFSQLITESVVSVSIASVFGLVFIIGILPYFSDFVNKDYSLSYILDPTFIAGAIFILLLVSFLSGAYPAFILSRFSIVKSLKGEQKVKSGKWMTQTLLGVQFVIATILIAGMITVQKQTQYLISFDTKINPENVMYFDYIPVEESRVELFAEELRKLPEVESVASVSGYNGTRMKGENQFDVRHLRIDNDLPGLLDIKIIQGRNLDSNKPSDESNILVNEAFARKYGLENPVGETVPFEYGIVKDPKIVGVVEDYHFESAKSTVDPLVIYTAPAYRLQSVFVKLNGPNTLNLSKFEALWEKHIDPFPFEYTFLEDEYEAQYASEKKVMWLVSAGCVISIILAAIGLLGVVGLQLNQRVKEISIRKVLGAPAEHLYMVFTKKFVLIIVIGMISGLLIGNYLIGQWLSNYPFRINFGLEIISITIIITLIISLSTIIAQVFKVISSNPVSYLRND